MLLNKHSGKVLHGRTQITRGNPSTRDLSENGPIKRYKQIKECLFWTKQMVFLTLRADEYEILQLTKLFILFQSNEKHCTLKVM